MPFLTCALLPSWVWLTSTSIDLCPVSAITLDEEPGMKWTDDKSDGGSDALPFSITHWKIKDSSMRFHKSPSSAHYLCLQFYAVLFRVERGLGGGGRGRLHGGVQAQEEVGVTGAGLQLPHLYKRGKER